MNITTTGSGNSVFYEVISQFRELRACYKCCVTRRAGDVVGMVTERTLPLGSLEGYVGVYVAKTRFASCNLVAVDEYLGEGEISVSVIVVIVIAVVVVGIFLNNGCFGRGLFFLLELLYITEGLNTASPRNATDLFDIRIRRKLEQRELHCTFNLNTNARKAFLMVKVRVVG